MVLAFLLLISFYFGHNPQHRFNIFLIPLTIFLLCTVIEDYKINLKFCLSFFLISIFYSKVYILLNAGPIPINTNAQDLYETSLQRFFMNTEYWVSKRGYIITSLITIITACLLFFTVKTSTLKIKLNA